jgi:phosphatidylserine/phosphatidylglycerophosphate/cardiolipin synthase-like enzyme
VADAAERGVSLAFLLPDHPNAGRCYTDDTIAWLRGCAPNAHSAGRLHFFTLAASAPGAGDGAARYRPIYVHAKVAVVDDLWATMGSANLNSRGMSHDAEMNVSALNAGFARSLRLALWREHLDGTAGSTDVAFAASPPLSEPLAAPTHQGMLALLRHDQETPRDEDALLAGDAVQGMAYLCERADDNLRRLCRGELLRGHLLPYLPFGEGAACGVDVDSERGYLDPLQSRIEQRPVPHPGRYT